jgi:hypothetical protein
LTGGQLIDLDCNTFFWMFGIKFTFYNLCDEQTSVKSLGAIELPAKLPAGLTYVMGVNVDVFTNGKIIKNLPQASGIEMDFPLYKQSGAEFALLYWNDPDGDGKGEWVDISKQLTKDKIFKTLSLKSTVELYQLIPTGKDLSFQTLTTDRTGTFVLVKK